jgi:hypothetical protein
LAPIRQQYSVYIRKYFAEIAEEAHPDRALNIDGFGAAGLVLDGGSRPVAWAVSSPRIPMPKRKVVDHKKTHPEGPLGLETWVDHYLG